MPTRSLLLKLVVPRSDEPKAVAIRTALWRTHAEVNAATAFYERSLLLLRGARYLTAGGVVTDEDARSAVLAHARQAQTKNLLLLGTPAASLVLPGDDGEVTALLSALYAAIVPAVLGGDGGAQAANAYLGPLTDPASVGFMAAVAKLDRPPPNWLALVGGDDAACLELANEWFASPASKAWRSDTGSPAAWLLKARVGDPVWPRLFARKLADLQRDARDGQAGLVRRLRALHLLPLFPPFFSGRIAGSDAAVTPWDRLAFRLAVSHLLSWESWNRRAAAEHEQRTAVLARFQAEHLTAAVAPAIEALRDFERERSAHLSTTGLGVSEYRLMGRQLRNWPDLRELWLRAGTADPDTLMQIAKKEQTRLRGRFGDPAVFAWLAVSVHQHVWRGQEDAPSILATLNAMQALVGRSRDAATMTLPDAVFHPRAVQWSSPGDSNLRPYRLSINGEGACWATLRLLASCDNGALLHDHEYTFRLAASDQLRAAVLGTRGKKAEVTYQATGDERLTGVLGSADLLLDRLSVSRRSVPALEAGDIGPAWLKLALDLDQQPRAGWTKDAARFANHFRHAAGKTTGQEMWVASGARVLSVDLGVGTFAACSVFSLTYTQPSAGRFALSLDVAGRALWAVHERSFHLTLADEVPDAEAEGWRREQTERLWRLRRCLSRYRRIMQLASVAPTERPSELDELRAALVEGDPFAFEEELLRALEGQTDMPDPVWAGGVASVLARFRAELNGIVKAWRREGRARSERRSGPSMWAIQHLSDVRRLLLGWSLLGRASGDVRRQDRAARGVFASRLLAHIDALKAHRLKAGADMIVQAARGYQRDKAGRWTLAQPACDLVLFEDLTRYRMKTDRPRRENSQLMLWAHRAMPAEVKMQGELYGLVVTDTGAAFSSRYHARSLGPGIRCRPITKADRFNIFLREQVAKDGFVLETMRPGDLVPWEGGAIFACLRPGGGLLRIDADINAAQNLQRRFWTRHAEAFRLPCRLAQLAGKQVFVPRSFGLRLLGAMGGHGLLEPIGRDSPAYRWRPMKLAELRKLGLASDGGGADRDAPDDTDTEELKGLADQVAEMSSTMETMFRDPSGVVLPAERWYPHKVYWGQVRAQTLKELRAMLGTEV